MKWIEEVMKNLFPVRYTFHLYDLSNDRSLKVTVSSGKSNKRFVIKVGSYINSSSDGEMRIIFVQKKTLNVHIHCVLTNKEDTK